MVHIGYMDGLVDDEDDGFSGCGSVVCDCGSDNLEFATGSGRIISRDVHNLTRS